MLGSDVLVEMLLQYGVKTIFGVPGDTNVPFYEALERRASEIEHVMARDERSAGFMADAYARLTDRPGVFECPSGAGATYSLPPVAESNASSVPVILLTIDLPLPGEGRGVITELDCARLFEPVTKMSVQVKSPQNLPDIIRRAFRAACSGTPGAVHLQIPEDMLLADIDVSRISLHAEPDCRTFPAYPAAPAPSRIHALYELLRNAERPLFIAGGGVNRSCAGAALTRLAVALNVPVVNTITGQGAIPDDHPLAIGVIGDNGFHPHANNALEECDLAIFVGSRMGSVVTVGWTFPKLTLNKRVVQVDINPERLANNYENLLSMACDARLFAEGMHAAIPVDFDETRHDAWVSKLNARRTEFWRHSERLLNATSSPLRPERVVHEFNRQLEKYGKPVHILSDAGTSTPYMTRYLRIRNPRTRFVIPRAFGGLGSAIPAVVGAWYADHQRRPIGMFGDGSFNMAVGELETLVRKRIPALLMLFNNGCFGWIKGLHRLRGHDECFGVDFLPPRGQAIAEAFDLKAWTVRDAAELATALEEAFAYDGPCLLDIHVESLANRVPPVYSWLSKTGADPLSAEPADVEYL
ncbi:MAG: thiamine pyrophosphate-binding protein [Pseudomonadota bacterium]